MLRTVFGEGVVRECWVGCREGTMGNGLGIIRLGGQGWVCEYTVGDVCAARVYVGVGLERWQTLAQVRHGTLVVVSLA